MAVIATTTSMLSSVLMTDSSQLSQDFNYVYANAKEASAADVKLGQVVLWNGTDAFRILKNADFSNDTTLTATAGAGFPDDKSRLAVVVGFDAVGSDYSKSVGTTVSLGQVIVGLIVSSTITSKLQVALFPAVSIIV